MGGGRGRQARGSSGRGRASEVLKAMRWASRALKRIYCSSSTKFCSQTSVKTLPAKAELASSCSFGFTEQRCNALGSVLSYQRVISDVSRALMSSHADPVARNSQKHHLASRRATTSTEQVETTLLEQGEAESYSNNDDNTDQHCSLLRHNDSARHEQQRD